VRQARLPTPFPFRPRSFESTTQRRSFPQLGRRFAQAIGARGRSQQFRNRRRRIGRREADAACRAGAPQVRFPPASADGSAHLACIEIREVVMASIHREVRLDSAPEAVWDVVRNVGQVHTRFAPGFVTDVVMEEGARMVTFGNGLVAREVIVDVDEARRRLAYSVRSERLEHHNASFQVLADGAGSRLVWIADVLPEAAAVNVGAMMAEGIEVARRAIDAANAPAGP
jgi:hypothetical protein